MAKMSLIQREKKRDQLVAKYAKKYAELKTATPRAWSCRSCRATPTRRASAIAAS